MKKPVICILSSAVCAAILAGTAGAAIYAADRKNDESAAVQTAAVTAAEAEISKDETVYVIAGADGSVQKIIVSDWLKNAAGLSSIEDKSELADAENVKGDETYSVSGDARVWDAQGGDIYYQGNIEKELPVNLSVSYTLDGRSISPAELAGKSGRVSIRFDYKNNQYENVEIDGKTEKIYVPFAMLTGILLDTDNFTNIEVSNGKLINDGSRAAVIGFALPGMQHDLGIDESMLKIPDCVEITADVKSFEMTSTVTVATNEIFSGIDVSVLDRVDSLTDDANSLSDAMRQLMDGSSELYGGLSTLLDKSGELISGIDRLADGAAALRSGAEALSSGAGELAQGAAELTSGLDALSSNSDALNAGSKQVFDTLLQTANSQLAAAGLSVPTLTAENYADVLNGVISSLDRDSVYKTAYDTALAEVTNAVSENEDAVRAAVTAAVEKEVTEKVRDSVRTGVEDQVLAAMGLTRPEYEAGTSAGLISAEQQAAFAAAVEAQMASDAVTALVTQNTAVQMQSADVAALINSKTEEQINALIEQNMNSAEVQGKITAALEQAASGAASISAIKGQLDAYNEFYTGLAAYTSGVDAADAGASELAGGANALDDGAGALYSGISELYDGIFTLKDGAPALKEGVTELKDGSMQLSDGLSEFYEQGVKKLCDAVNGDLAGLSARLRATIDVSKAYRSFSGISDGMDGQVRFIYRTESVKAGE